MAEAFTGKQGEDVSLEDTLNDVRKILDGTHDSLDLNRISYTGRIMEI